MIRETCRALKDEEGPSDMPFVRFSNSKNLLVSPKEFTVELNDEKLASGTQVPKDKQLTDVFENGQACVAMSRASDPKFLRVRGCR